MTNLTAAALPDTLELDDAIEQLRNVSIYELAELVHKERSRPAGARTDPIVALYERYIDAVAVRAAKGKH